MALFLIRCEESKLAARVRVSGERIFVGSSPESTIAIPHPSVSPVHVIVTRNVGGYCFQDLWSEAGTFLNGQRREQGALRPGDVLRIGQATLTIIEADIAPPGASPPPAEAGTSRRLKSLGSGGRLILGGVGLVAAGLVLGVLAGWGASPSSTARPEIAGPAGATKAAQVEAPKEEAAAPTKEEAGIEGTEATTVAGDATEAGEAERTASALLEGLRRPPVGPDEARRTLQRLCLDLLGRPPTRAEAREWLPLSHEERWKKIAAEIDPPGGDPVEEAYRRFLARPPADRERQAFASSRLGAAANGFAGIGLLLTASDEYRRADHRRPRSLDQRARGLLVDFLDRPPASEEEVRELAEALREASPLDRVLRILAFSPEATRALPPLGFSAARSGSGPAAREWLSTEFFRFTGRPASEAELRALEKEVRDGEGARRARLVLAEHGAYRGY